MGMMSSAKSDKRTKNNLNRNTPKFTRISRESVMSLLDNDLDDGDELDSTPRSNPTPKLKVQMMVLLH